MDRDSLHAETRALPDALALSAWVAQSEVGVSAVAHMMLAAISDARLAWSTARPRRPLDIRPISEVFGLRLGLGVGTRSRARSRDSRNRSGIFPEDSNDFTPVVRRVRSIGRVGKINYLNKELFWEACFACLLR